MEEKEKRKGILSASPKEIWLMFRKRFLDTVPKKRYINLAAVGVRRINWFLAVPAILLILVGASLFAKFLVLDRVALVEKERQELTALQMSLAESTRDLENYDALAEQYAHYTRSGMNEEELARADRLAVMDLLARAVMPYTALENWTLNGNELTMNIHSGSLQEVNRLIQALLREEIVDYCDVSTAATEQGEQTEASESSVSATVTVLVKNIQNGEPEGEAAAASGEASE